jgi:hypothetical protein
MLDIQKRRVQLLLFVIGVVALSMTGMLPHRRISNSTPLQFSWSIHEERTRGLKNS